jgi:histidinol-phosphatase (PHP family)
MIDYHVHPNYSIDAQGTLEEFCLSALRANLREICFTTHLDSEPTSSDGYVVVNGKRLGVLDNRWLEDYESKVRGAADSFKERGLTVLLGVEVDYFPGVAEALPDRFHDTGFDMIMGSVHLIDRMQITTEPEAQNAFAKLSIQQLGDRYYQLLIECAETGLFNVLGHMDVYRRYGEKFYGADIHSIWLSHVKQLAASMKRHHIGFEVNTSPWRRGMEQPMPETLIIKALRKAGIKTVTIGSDAHNPNDVGAGVEKALSLIKECGFSSPSRFREKRAIPLSIKPTRK